MNPETTLNLFAALLSKRSPSISGRWSIINRDGVFLCRTIETIEPGEYEFGRYNEEDLTAGLTRKQWNKLKRNVTEYHTQKGL